MNIGDTNIEVTENFIKFIKETYRESFCRCIRKTDVLEFFIYQFSNDFSIKCRTSKETFVVSVVKTFEDGKHALENLLNFVEV